MRETVELLISGTDKGDVKVTFDKIADIDRYINTLLVMREDLEAKIEVAKAKKREERLAKKAEKFVNKKLDKQVAELDELYADFCNDFEKLSRADQERASGFKSAIDMLYGLGKSVVEARKQNNE